MKVQGVSRLPLPIPTTRDLTRPWLGVDNHGKKAAYSGSQAHSSRFQAGFSMGIFKGFLWLKWMIGNICF